MDLPIEIFLSFIGCAIIVGVIGLWKRIPFLLLISGALIAFWAITTDNIQLGFSEPSSITSTIEEDIDYYAQLTRTGSLTLSNGSNIFVGEKVNTITSLLYNKDIDEVCIALGKTGTPTGTATIAIYNTLATPTTANAIYVFGTIDVTTLPTTSLATYCFENESIESYSLFLNVAFGVFYDGGSVGNNINTDSAGTNPFDGTNTIQVRHSTSWTSVTASDIYGLARLNIMVEDTVVTSESNTITFDVYPKILFGLIGSILMLAGSMIWKFDD